jgi:putative spermidine/putrescine transport system ATP-binding protein
MAALALSAISKVFDDTTALDRVDLHVQEGEFISLLGPSGCGKTTLLRIISGLESPSSGSLSFNGIDATHASITQRHVGMVFQHFALFPHMTVEKNVSFGLRMAGLDARAIHDKTSAMLDVVQLAKERKRYPSQLSGGQQQRVALARTLITEPSVLLMDEPFSSLDTVLRQEMHQFVSDLHQRLGTTTVLVTHDQQEAMVLSDRIALMFQGNIVQYATPEVLYNQPSSAAVAQFMGATNLISAQPIAVSRWQTAVGELSTIGISNHFQGEHWLSIRPENIQIVEQTQVPSPLGNCITGQLIAKKYHGAFSELTIAAGRTHIQVLSAAHIPFVQGNQVQLVLPEQHLFPIPKSIG